MARRIPTRVTKRSSSSSSSRPVRKRQRSLLQQEPSTDSPATLAPTDGAQADEDMNTSQSQSQDFFDAQSQPLPTAEQQPFRLMDLPAELRLNIYRCCLTRPYAILLHKEPPAPVEMSQEEKDWLNKADSDEDSDDDAGDDGQEGVRAANENAARVRVQRGFMSYWDPRRRQTMRTMGRPRFVQPGGVARPAGPQRAPSALDTLRRRSSALDSPSKPEPAPRSSKPQDSDPLIPTILRTNKQIYKEARNVLYADNAFILQLSTAQNSLAALHQRSRSQIKHIELTIPTHHDILEKFAEVVRLSLRYCWQLQTFVVKLPFQIPGQNDDGTMSASGGTNVYANAFNILRWLPKTCKVSLEGTVCEDIKRVVAECARMASTLDKGNYALAQKQVYGPDVPGAMGHPKRRRVD